MDFSELVAGRRSIRGYGQKPVSRETLARILEAARLAPSAANRQPFKIYVIEDPELRHRLGDAYHNAWFYEAPAIAAIAAVPEWAWSRCDGKNYADVDAAIAFEHLILAAHAEGLGTCWIAAFQPDVVRKVLELPAGFEPLALTPLGYPAQAPRETFRKPLHEIVEFR